MNPEIYADGAVNCLRYEVWACDGEHCNDCGSRIPFSDPSYPSLYQEYEDDVKNALSNVWDKWKIKLAP